MLPAAWKYRLGNRNLRRAGGLEKRKDSVTSAWCGAAPVNNLHREGDTCTMCYVLDAMSAAGFAAWRRNVDRPTTAVLLPRERGRSARVLLQKSAPSRCCAYRSFGRREKVPQQKSSKGTAHLSRRAARYRISAFDPGTAAVAIPRAAVRPSVTQRHTATVPAGSEPQQANRMLSVPHEVQF